MTDAIILGAAVVAGLACPLHMWWSNRRGRQAACCPSIRTPEGEGEIEALRARQQRLSTLIAEREASRPAVADQTRPAARS
jgi:hypothetical protein